MLQAQFKEPPHSKESEMMVLGCMLTSVHALNYCAETLEDSDFYYTEHKIIFDVLNTAYKNNKPVDLHLVCEELKRQDKLKIVGGAGYIAALVQYVGTFTCVEEYAKLVKQHSMKRQAIQVGEKLIKRAQDRHELDPLKVILESQEDLKNIERRNYTKDRFPIEFLNEIDKEYLFKEPPKKPMLLEYANEDGKTLGFLPKGIVAMLVGAGGVGKSHLLSQLAISVSTGTPWLGIFYPTKHCGEKNRGNVFLGFGENNDEDIKRVLYKASKNLRQHQPDFVEEDPIIEASKHIAPFSFCGQHAAFIENGQPSAYYRGLKMRLIERAPKDGWALIILDPVSRLLGADAETDNAAATQFIALLEELTLDLPGNPTVLIAHHVNKSSLQQGSTQQQSAARGASALTDGARWQVNLAKGENEEGKREETHIIFKMTKTNFTPILEEIKLLKDSDGILRGISKKNSPFDRKTTTLKNNQK